MPSAPILPMRGTGGLTCTPPQPHVGKVDSLYVDKFISQFAVLVTRQSNPQNFVTVTMPIGCVGIMTKASVAV